MDSPQDDYSAALMMILLLVAGIIVLTAGLIAR